MLGNYPGVVVGCSRKPQVVKGCVCVCVCGRGDGGCGEGGGVRWVKERDEEVRLS